GALLGLTLCEYLIGLCKGANNYRSSVFYGDKYPLRATDNGVNADFHWEDFFDVGEKQLALSENARDYAEVENRRHRYGKESAPLRWLWEKAKEEWARKN